MVEKLSKEIRAAMEGHKAQMRQFCVCFPHPANTHTRRNTDHNGVLSSLVLGELNDCKGIRTLGEGGLEKACTQN